MNVHIIGIAGKTTASIAHMFLTKGWEVTGSDVNVFPPNSTYLEKIGVNIKTPYSGDNLSSDCDLVVVGGNALIVDPHNPEFEKAVLLNKKIVTYPEVLGEYVVKPNSIVVAGNFGKGTITGALALVLSHLSLKPSFMVGGQLVDLPESLVSDSGEWSVIEGDEYPVPPIGSEPPCSKFFYYHPRFLVITSSEWDHYDQFPTEELYVQNYIELVKTLPKDGLLVVNRDGKNIDRIVPYAPCRVVTYSRDDESDYQTKELLWKANVIGDFNLDNLTAAYALLCELGFDSTEVKKYLELYRGLKQRMEVVYQDDQAIVVRDFAHSPVKAEACIRAAKITWPNHTICAVFEIYSSSLKNASVLTEFDHRFDGATAVYIPKVSITRTDEYRITGKDIASTIAKTRQQVHYVPQQDRLLAELLNQKKPCVYVLMSSGGMDGFDLRLIHELQRKVAVQKMNDVLNAYIEFSIGGVKIIIPYVRNATIFNLARTAGKGSPEMIANELIKYAKKENFDLKDHSPSDIFKFMRAHHIGVECSGFVYHVLDAYVFTLTKKRLSDLLHGRYGALEKLLLKPLMYRRVNADMLTNDTNSVSITDLNLVREGDLIRMSVRTPGDHVLLVVGVERENQKTTQIFYAHSSYERTVNQGPHISSILITDATQGLSSQVWNEKTPHNESYRMHFHPERGDMVRRLRVLTENELELPHV